MIVDLPEKTPPTPNRRALGEARRPGWVEVTPGRWARRRPGKLPGHVVCRALDNGDGTVRFEPLPEKMVKITPEVTTALGLGRRADTLHRLGRAGFVEVLFPSPNLALLNVDSYMNHLRRVSEDGEFWARKANLEAYRAVLPAGVTR
jgi:hypothetical protein